MPVSLINSANQLQVIQNKLQMLQYKQMSLVSDKIFSAAEKMEFWISKRDPVDLLETIEVLEKVLTLIAGENLSKVQGSKAEPEPSQHSLPGSNTEIPGKQKALPLEINTYLSDYPFLQAHLFQVTKNVEFFA